MVLRSLCFAAAGVLVACTSENVGPATAPSTVVVPGSATAPAATSAVALAPTCGSDDDCARGLCMPKPVTGELSDAEEFLERSMALHDLVVRLGDTSSSSRLNTILQQVKGDLSTYSQMARGRIPAAGGAAGGTSAVAQGARPTQAQIQGMQDAAWFRSGATQAYVLIQQLAFALSRPPVTTDAKKVYTDVTGDSAGLHVDDVVVDLQTLIHDVQAAIAQTKELVEYREDDGGVPDLKSAAGAMAHYVGPDIEALDDAMIRIKMLAGSSASSRLEKNLTLFSRAHDLVGKGGNLGTCLGAAQEASGSGGATVKAQ